MLKIFCAVLLLSLFLLIRRLLSEPPQSRKESETSRAVSTAPDCESGVHPLNIEMKAVFEQLGNGVAQNPEIASNLLREMVYEAGGLENFRALACFAGPDCLRPALARMPRNLAERALLYLESSSHQPVKFLHGLDIAQRLVRDLESNVGFSRMGNAVSDDLRNTLLKTDDRTLAEFSRGARPEQIALLLNTIPVKRANTIIESIRSEVLKQAFTLLDAQKDLPALAGEIAASLESLQRNERDSSSQSQKRMILRMVRSAGFEQEASVSNLVAADDWEMRYAMMETKFFFRDLVFVGAKPLRAVLDSLGSRGTAEFAVICPVNLRNRIFAAYEDNPKLLAMVREEMRAIEKNIPRRNDVEKRKNLMIDSVMQKLRGLIAVDRKLLDEVVANQSRNLDNLRTSLENRAS